MSTSILPARSGSRSGALRRADFRRIVTDGDRRAGSLLTLFVARREDAQGRVGLTAGRRVGGAVARNRARRLMREAWRGLMTSRAVTFDAVVVAQPAIEGCGLEEVRRELADLLEAAGVLG